MSNSNRFAFPTEHSLVFTGATARFKANILALETLKLLETSDDDPTPEQLLALAHYTGWGDTQVYKQAFPEGNYDDATADARIEAILTKQEQLSVADSILNAHYTALPIIKAMYDALLHLGMRSTEKQPLRILEPAGGSGNFIGMMPPELREHSRIKIVEMDEISCRLMEQLYPETNIENKQFENCYFPKNSFDLIISNVPFGQGKIFDPVFIKPNYLKRAIHDYYFARAVQLAKPGGVIAFITSRYTLDKADNQVRKFLAENTELLAITRLPSDTFKANAGTEVVTDILILQKKTEEERVAQYYANDEAYPDWVSVKEAAWLSGDMFLNKRYVKQKSLIAGIATTRPGQHYMKDFWVEPTARPTAQLATEILKRQLTKNSYCYVATLNQKEQEETEIKLPPTDGLVKEPLRNKQFTERIEALYTQAKEMLDLQARGVLSEAARATVRLTYNTFRENYGAINHKNNTRYFQTDHPCFGLLSALEEGDTFTPSAILTGESIRGEGEVPAELVPTDALSICLNRYGKVKLGFIANLMEQTEEQVVAGLTERIYLNDEGEYELTETFCSGNVRKKLNDYERRHPQPNAEQQRAIEGLQKSIPAWIPWTGIGAKLGSPWIPSDVIELFIFEILNQKIEVKYISALGSWSMSSTSGYGVECRQTYGTSHKNALDLIDDALNLKTPKVMKHLDNPERIVVDQGESLAAQAKLAEIKIKFIEWLSDDADRIERLEKIYNETHNNFKEPTYDGSHLTLPGLSLAVVPRPHQKNMVWRMVLSQSSLAAHVGGAGKTGEAIMAAMEMRRMGLVKKPVAVVPNGLTKQWADEARMFYPAMKIYAPDKESLSAKNRAKLLARIATGDFDLLILPYTAMKALPMKAEAMREYIIEQVDELEDFLREDEHKNNKQIKRATKALKVKLATIDEQIKRDDQRNITFEETGIDFLIVDEAHNFKNLFYTTKAERVAGMPNTDSQRAFDLFLKTQYLMKRHGRLALLTATPVSNSIVETYTAMRYTMLAQMKELGLAHFDAWLQTYAETIQTLEMRPDCSGFRMVTRLSKFNDLPELRALWGQTLDIKTAEQLQLDRPEIIGGKPEVVTIAQSPELKEIIVELADRSSKVDPRTPEKDNMLCITTDGRKAALDVRLYRPHLEETENNKMKTCAERAGQLYRQYDAEKGTQLIFCDIGTPRPKELKETDAPPPEFLDDTAEEIQDGLLHTSFYEGLRQKLIKQGIPREEIIFIHEAKTAEDKAKLFGRMKRGEIRILIGSTSKCGVGMNAQDKVVAIHHLDSPWRPTDIDQRNWRGQRPGNQFKAIHILIYVTEQSFDAYTWGILENKMRSITQLMAPVVTVRTAEDISDVVLDAAQIKALASGNPRILEKVATETQLARLEKIYQTWMNDRHWLKSSTANKARIMEVRTREEAIYQEFLAIAISHEDTPMVAFRDGHPVELAAKEVTGFMTSEADVAMARAFKGKGTHQAKIAEYQGLHFELLSYSSLDRHQLLITSPEAPDKQVQLRVKWSVKSTIEHCAETMAEEIKQAREEVARTTVDLAKAQAELARGWRYADEYKSLQEKLLALNQELTEVPGEVKEFAALEEDAFIPTEVVAEENSLAMAATVSGPLTPFVIDPAIAHNNSFTTEPPPLESQLPVTVEAELPTILVSSEQPAFQPDTNQFVMAAKPVGKRKSKRVHNENQLSLFG